MKSLFTVLTLLVCAFQLQGQQNAYVSPAGTKFLLYTPPSYSSGTDTHPLLISLHGKGEMGDDLNKLTVNNPNQPPSRLIYLNRWSSSLPFIVLSPLFTPPADELNPQWPADYIDEVVNHVISNYRVDLSRIYVTGLSLGGTGTWTYAAAFPQKVAAILPISGRSDLTKACALKNIPAWVFHGDGDPTVTMQYSIDMINAINLCKVSALYKRNLTILYSKAHYGWSEVYNGSNGSRVYEWLLKFQKNNTTNTAPYVNAGIDRTIMMRPGSHHIYGDYFDSDGTISNVQWQQISGPPLNLLNTNSPFFRINSLQPGTFEFELNVTDNHGATSSDRVRLTVLSTTTMPVVSRIVLMNGETNTDIMELKEAMVINKAQLGVTQFNVRAETTSGANSIRFSLNADQHARTLNAPTPFILKPTSSTRPEWEMIPGHYVLCAAAHANLGASGPGCTSCVKFRVIDEVNVPGCSGYGKIHREIWPGITGTSVSNIPVNTVPVAKTDLLLFESPTDVWDNFGERIRGYVCPPATGDYTFWISGNDDCELWLSTDATAANKVRIAYVNGFTDVRQWTKYDTQQSASIPLTAGTKYYIEALHKEGIESDHMAVGWRLPDGTLERPISGLRLIPLASGAQESVAELQETEEETSMPDVRVYPNPLRPDEHNVYVKWSNRTKENVVRQIRVLSVSGQEIYSSSVTCDSCDEHLVELNRGLPPGMFVVLIEGQRDRTVRKLIRQ